MDEKRAPLTPQGAGRLIDAEFQVTVDVGIGEEVRRLGDVYDVVEDGDSEGGDESGFLDEGVGTITLSVPIGILQDYDPVTGGSLPLVAPIVDPLRDPDPASVVDVHVGRDVEMRSGGPDGHFQGRVNLEHPGGDGPRGLPRFPVVGYEGRRGHKKGKDENREGVHRATAIWAETGMIPRGILPGAGSGHFLGRSFQLSSSWIHGFLRSLNFFRTEDTSDGWMGEPAFPHSRRT